MSPGSLASRIQSAFDPVRRDYPTPPLCFWTQKGLRGQIEPAAPDSVEPLVEMYNRFAPEDRAQGIPPVGEEPIRSWLSRVSRGHSLVAASVEEPTRSELAWGHALLVPVDDRVWELGIFVLHEVQGQGIGTVLLNALLGYAQSKNVAIIWLTVERWNRAAIKLYRNVGFEMFESQRMELEMALILDDS